MYFGQLLKKGNEENIVIFKVDPAKLLHQSKKGNVVIFTLEGNTIWSNDGAMTETDLADIFMHMNSDEKGNITYKKDLYITFFKNSTFNFYFADIIKLSWLDSDLILLRKWIWVSIIFYSDFYRRKLFILLKNRKKSCKFSKSNTKNRAG